jgi:non-ribosomal peptide synthetase component E (peptide arylation enzyme)
MRLVDYLDKGASLGADAPCLTTHGKDLSYGDVQRLSYRIARGLANSGTSPGEKIAILSGNDPIAFASVCLAFRAPELSGAPSIHAMRRQKTSSSSMRSIAVCCCFTAASRRWSTE